MSSEAFYQRLSSHAEHPAPPAELGAPRTQLCLTRPPAGEVADLDTREVPFCPLPVTIEPGTRIDDYRVIEQLGGGGVTMVLRAYQESRDREVALKVLSPHLFDDDEAVKRFETEAELAARIAHPGVVPTLGHGTDGGYHFHAMKWMEGPTLEEFLDGAVGEPGDPFYRRAARLFGYLARTVAFLHDTGIVHRDIKPANLFLINGGAGADRIVLGDFGTAVDLSAPRSALEADTVLPGGDRVLHGTPAYMSPERFLKEDAAFDPRVDIYSIGLTLYELVTGCQPFVASSHEEVARLKLTRKPPAPHVLRPDIPLGLEAIIRQAIDTHPALRYGTAEELARDLERFALARRANTRTHSGAGLPAPDPAGGDGGSESDDGDGDGDGEPALI